MKEPYNPLSKINLARSIEGEILACPLVGLGEVGRFDGAGIYALYYAGEFEVYAPLKASLLTSNPRPIYVGKAIPAGGRTGGLGSEAVRTLALSQRLAKHAASIKAAENLRLQDFQVRYLVVDDVWIPLGENMLIETYQPVWNKLVAGFGNNPPGEGRRDQQVSLWDVLHPGRSKNVSIGHQSATSAELQERVRHFFT